MRVWASAAASRVASCRAQRCAERADSPTCARSQRPRSWPAQRVSTAQQKRRNAADSERKLTVNAAALRHCTAVLSELRPLRLVRGLRHLRARARRRSPGARAQRRSVRERRSRAPQPHNDASRSPSRLRYPRCHRLGFRSGALQRGGPYDHRPTWHGGRKRLVMFSGSGLSGDGLGGALRKRCERLETRVRRWAVVKASSPQCCACGT